MDLTQRERTEKKTDSDMSEELKSLQRAALIRKKDGITGLKKSKRQSYKEKDGDAMCRIASSSALAFRKGIRLFNMDDPQGARCFLLQMNAN